MALDIWEACDGKKNIVAIRETAWRITELQEKLSTRKLVDSLEEQKILEELIDQSKPEFLISQADFHPLLLAPFRLLLSKYASRFGKKTETSLWYGSLNIRTAMAEKAFYQLAFLNASDTNFGTITSSMTTFSAPLAIINGIKLTEAPFIKFKKEISSSSNYEHSQRLGTNMRECKIDGFTYFSARDINTGINIGLFTMNGFASKNPNPQSFETWQCYTTKINIEFIQIGSLGDKTYTFPIQDFQVDGKLPLPAMA
jgi:hypothetical protein